VTCGAATSWETTWVGIDGQTNATVEQAGTATSAKMACPTTPLSMSSGLRLGENEDCRFAPYVERPGGARRLSVAEVSFANGHWVFMVDDATAGWHSSTPVAQPIRLRLNRVPNGLLRRPRSARTFVRQRYWRVRHRSLLRGRAPPSQRSRARSVLGRPWRSPYRAMLNPSIK